MRFLLGTCAINQHVQNIALALHEAGALSAYYAGGADNYRYVWGRTLRAAVQIVTPSLDRQLKRRRVATVPSALVHRDWMWEAPRAVASMLGLDARLQDWLWERSEYRLDRRCVRRLAHPDADAFFGVEHGAFSSIVAAKSLGKRSVVAFLSLHHAVREKWVDPEYERFPQLVTKATRRLLALGKARDARRDEEARLADAIHTNSALTKRTLVMAGCPAHKIVAVPLGSPPAIAEEMLPASLPDPVRIVYCGPVSVHKGAHYLLDAWRQLRVQRGAELHCYGANLLPRSFTNDAGSNVVFHGSVPRRDLMTVYQRAAILVFPTLCDGFGAVVGEAFANGLPVLTTRNAGAADLVLEGLNGFLVPPADSHALAERMEWCIQHPDQLIEMRRHALAAARRWTWADFRTSLRRQLGEVLNVWFPEPTVGGEG